ncbi:hypothetical protein GCM10023191_071500 [Actinoallomurus oryzae]|uniref:Uncharacterized protein n=1 Tax=Actinoallomurus oryzae TaxID=502180 RepID=A0ABP8QTZ1_9ACTN
MRRLDLMLRLGAYGDGFAAVPGGLSLEALRRAPHGIDLGPLRPRLPEVLRTPSGRIELCPPRIAEDVGRLRDAAEVPPRKCGVLVCRVRGCAGWWGLRCVGVQGPGVCRLVGPAVCWCAGSGGVPAGRNCVCRCADPRFAGRQGLRLCAGRQGVVARPGWTLASGVGRAAGRRPCRRQIQETPRILIPFPEMVRPTRRRSGWGLRGTQGGDERLRA